MDSKYITSADHLAFYFVVRSRKYKVLPQHMTSWKYVSKPVPISCKYDEDIALNWCSTNRKSLFEYFVDIYEHFYDSLLEYYNQEVNFNDSSQNVLR